MLLISQPPTPIDIDVSNEYFLRCMPLGLLLYFDKTQNSTTPFHCSKKFGKIIHLFVDDHNAYF